MGEKPKNSGEGNKKTKEFLLLPKKQRKIDLSDFERRKNRRGKM